MGIPEPTIGRLVYLNCKYGVIKPARGKPAAAPKIEIGVSLYNSPAQASKRVKGTIEDYRSHGSSQVDTVAGKLPATILLGYGHPTLVAVAGPRSVAVTVDSKFSGTRRNNDLRAVAAVVLESTAHFIAASPSASESPSATSTS
jgi:hypothetical protein